MEASEQDDLPVQLLGAGLNFEDVKSGGQPADVNAARAVKFA